MFKKTRNRKSAAYIVFFVVFLFVLGLAIYLAYINFFPTRPFYLSPVANQDESPIDKTENALTKAGITFTQIIASNSSYVVFLEDGGRIILPSKGDIESKIYSLQLILKQFTIEGKKFSKIDLRFNKPTILFK